MITLVLYGVEMYLVENLSQDQLQFRQTPRRISIPRYLRVWVCCSSIVPVSAYARLDQRLLADRRTRTTSRVYHV